MRRPPDITRPALGGPRDLSCGWITGTLTEIPHPLQASRRWSTCTSVGTSCAGLKRGGRLNEQHR